MTDAPIDGNGVRLRQMVPAPRDEVFAAFTRPEVLQQWWGPGAFTCPTAEVDLRPGGRYRLVMQPPDGSDPVVVGGVYEAVEPPSRLVYTWAWEAGAPTGEPESHVVVEFFDRDGDTEVVVTHSRFPEGHDITDYGGGWVSGLEKLAALLSREGSDG